MSEIHEQVAEDLLARHEIGVKEYGVSLRDAKVDSLQYAYAEALDLAMYLRKELNDRTGHE